MVVQMNWSWTQACVKAAEDIFGIKKHNVFHLAKLHRDSDNTGLPAELPRKKVDVDQKFSKEMTSTKSSPNSRATC